MGFGNPLLRFGCWANGEHVWSKKYETWQGWEHQCLWCDHTERCRPPKRVRREMRVMVEEHDDEWSMCSFEYVGTAAAWPAV